MEESKVEEAKVEESPLNQICTEPFEISLVSQSNPSEAQNQTLVFQKQRDEIKIEEDEMKEDLTVPAMRPPNAEPSNKIPLFRSTIRHIRILYQKFNPKIISSSTKQSFLPHEAVFRTLNLWEFLNLDFESEVRSDLIAELICTYKEFKYCAFVRGLKINVGKFDLAHALKIPLERNETHESIYKKDEIKDVLLIFLSRFVLLDDEDEDDDMCILPEEAIQAIKLVKNGTPNEVDWCGLIWGLVEKDMVDAYKSGYCKFASYLQCLIKTQTPNLLLEDVYVPESESLFDGSESSSSSLEEAADDEREGYNVTESSLGKNDNMDLMNDIDWSDEGCNKGFEFGLRRCDSNNARNMEFENFCKDENSMEEHDGFLNSEGLNSSELLHSYNPQMNLLDQNVGLSNFFDDNIVKGKMHVDAADIDEYYHQNNQQKRMRIDAHREEERPQSGFDPYIEQIQSTIEKAKMLYVEKEQACVNAHLQLQCLNEMLMQKDEAIGNLERTQVEEQQTWEFTVGRYRHELNVLANPAFSYRKALKETQKKFDEYRKMCPEGDEFLYHDVTGLGGSVLTSNEIEKLKFEREEEMKLIAVEMVNVFECEWLVKLDEYTEWLLLKDMKLAEFEEKVQRVKERFAECKNLLTSKERKIEV